MFLTILIELLTILNDNGGMVKPLNIIILIHEEKQKRGRLKESAKPQYQAF